MNAKLAAHLDVIRAQRNVAHCDVCVDTENAVIVWLMLVDGFGTHMVLDDAVLPELPKKPNLRVM